ncbi:hypothetical protein KCH_77840 [Kitasatospora cheerisanensis KCTC 2395]|uniref:Uncharacterized protein n=1 Tax=Kitasatospora cheerisanensis KCTC 2395 TaxID=1348663 RepID=A0A066YH18_9ACTN|nr:hypothetical protein KCH_77840 [Kitasatospora cheerisanensis KCTC 2395]
MRRAARHRLLGPHDEAGLVPIVSVPSEDHAAVLLDDRGRVWAECPTGGGSDDLVLPLVFAREEAVSVRGLAEQGVRLTHVGWVR